MSDWGMIGRYESKRKEDLIEYLNRKQPDVWKLYTIPDFDTWEPIYCVTWYRIAEHVEGE